MERWLDIIGYEGRYQVSDTGRVRSFPKKNLKSLRILRPSLSRYGYLIVDLCSGVDKPKKHRVHRLVLTAFVSIPEKGEVCNHINGIKTDNHLENLEWCSQAHNTQHAWGTGLTNPRKGSGCYGNKLTESHVKEILSSLESGVTLAKKYNVVSSIISDIRNGKRWKHVERPEGYRAINSNRKLTEAQAKEVLTSTETQKDIANRYGVNRSAISKIRGGKNWKHLSKEIH